MQPQHSPQFLRKRKFLLVLPLLMLPFVCIVFAALGGGKGAANNASATAATKGFNMNLPGAHFTKKEMAFTKMGFYEKADADSAKLQEQIRQDPYHAKSALLPEKPAASAGHFSTTLSAAPPEDSNANKLLRQLDQLKQILRRPAIPEPPPSSLPITTGPALLSTSAPGTNRLQHLLQTIRSADTAGSDPQLEKLSGMLDKIIQIQHPSSHIVPDSAKSTLPQPGMWKVSILPDSPTVTSLPAGNPEGGDTALDDDGGFYSIDETDSTGSVIQNTIAAVIPEDQTLVAGATITLRLTQDAVVSGVTIPHDNLVYGQVAISGDRMLVTVSSIRNNQAIYPVGLQVFDLDGLPGIHIPGAITRDVMKESADQGISAMGLTSLDPSLGAQAATAGIQAAKTLLSRKIKLVRVSVKAGYQVLLKNTKV